MNRKKNNENSKISLEKKAQIIMEIGSSHNKK